MDILYKQALIEHNKDKTAHNKNNLKKYFKSLLDQEKQELLQKADPGTELGDKLFEILSDNSLDNELREYTSELLESWLARNISDKASKNTLLVKHKLQKLFPSHEDWDLIDPPGDGFCTLYASFIDAGLQIVDKDYIIELLIKGTKDFFKYEVNNERDKSLIIEMDPGSGIFDYVSPDSTDEELKEIYNKLKHIPNTPTQLISFLKYALNTNIILLSYDYRSSTPFLQTYYKNNNPDIVVQSQVDSKYTILFMYLGHTFLLHNKNAFIKAELARKLLNNPNLWQVVPKARGLIKRKTKKKFDRKTNKRKINKRTNKKGKILRRKSKNKNNKY